MATKRTTVTIPIPMWKVAQELMDMRVFTDLSGFMQTLIREEAERKGLLPGNFPPVTPPSSPTTSVHKKSPKKAA